MPRSTQVYYSFGAGVLSPSMEARVDAQAYERASRIMQNWVVTPQGGITMRHGSAHTGSPKVNQSFRLFSFKRGGNDSDVLFEMTAGTTRFWKDDDLQVDDVSAPLESLNPYELPDLPTVQFANQEQVAVTVHENHPPLYVTFRGDRGDPEEIITQYFPRDEIPQYRFNDFKSTIFIPKSSSYDIEFVDLSPQGPSWTPGDRFYFLYDGRLNVSYVGFITPIEYTYSSVAADMVAELEKAVRDNPVLKGRATVANTGTDQYSITVTDTSVAGRVLELRPINQQLLISITGNGVTEDTIGAEPVWSYAQIVEHPAENDGGEIHLYRCRIAHESEAGTNEPGLIDTSTWPNFWEDLGRKAEAAADVLFQYDYMFGDVNAEPPVLGDNPWADNQLYAVWNRGFPKTLTFHQQRLYFANTRDRPSTVWGSKIGDYTEFTVGVNDDDPVEFTLASQGTPAIQWMASLNGLYMGTSSGDWRIDGAVTITPTTINASKQNNSRSALTPAQIVNNEAISIQLGSRKVHSSYFVRDAGTSIAQDITSIAEHLFREGVRDIALSQIPNTILNFVRNSGDVIGMTLNRETDVAAFYEWTTGPDGTHQFLDAASIYDIRTNEEVFYYATLRNGTYAIEKIIQPPQDFKNLPNLQGIVYLDAYQTSTTDLVNATQITGIDARFEGQTVGVVINDAWEGEFTVTGGTITLPEARSGYWALGFRYKATDLTFERTTGNPQGVALGTKRRWNKLYARLVDSSLPLINGQRPADRTPSTPMNTPEPLRSQDVRVHNVGWGDGSLTIEQDLPFPTHVVGLYGQVGINDA